MTAIICRNVCNNNIGDHFYLLVGASTLGFGIIGRATAGRQMDQSQQVILTMASDKG